MTGIQGRIAQYPFGFNNGVSIRGLPVLNAHSNLVVWVDSNKGNDGNPGTVALPFASLAGAINALNNVSNSLTGRIGNTLNGAIVMLKPYHAETLSAATTYSLASCSIIGVSTGDGDIPTFTLSTAAGAGIVLGSADMQIKNVKIIDNQGVTVALKLANKGQIADSIKIIDGSASFTTGISIVGGGSNKADRCSVINCYLRSAGATNGILLSEVDDQVTVSNNILQGSFSTAAIQNPTSTVLTNLYVNGNIISNTNASGKGLNFVSACTGHCVDNRVIVTTRASEIVASTAMNYLGNLGSATNGLDQYAVPLGITSDPIVAVSAIKALPQTTTSTVATVSGGAVILEAIVAEVTTAIQNQLNNTKFTFTDTAGSTATDICAVTTIANLGVGSFFYPKLDAAATALVTVASGTSSVAFAEQAGNGVIMGPGTLVINCAASNTGNVKYHLRYRSLQPGATITLS